MSHSVLNSFNIGSRTVNGLKNVFRVRRGAENWQIPGEFGSISGSKRLPAVCNTCYIWAFYGLNKIDTHLTSSSLN